MGARPGFNGMGGQAAALYGCHAAARACAAPCGAFWAMLPSCPPLLLRSSALHSHDTTIHEAIVGDICTSSLEEVDFTKRSPAPGALIHSLFAILAAIVGDIRTSKLEEVDFTKRRRST